MGFNGLKDCRPDSETAGGGLRGQRSVELQYVRSIRSTAYLGSSDPFPSDQNEGARCLRHQPIDVLVLRGQVAVVFLDYLDPISQPPRYFVN